MNEGEKKKKVYTRGDIVTFRLLKRMKFDDNVLDLINTSNELNKEIIVALELYCKYKEYKSKILEQRDDDIIRNFFNNTEEPISKPIKQMKKYSEPKINEPESEELYNDEVFSKDILESEEEKIFSSEDSLNIVSADSEVFYEIESVEDEIFSSGSKAEEEKSNGLARAFKTVRRK
ncbi:hypothetical protein [Clostridium hydrogeniformans]|uniref:hypothetical protein n=1 Tax=Clostridium hydrogeniformans TaxID=349933 RepID=UPI00047F9EF3|nr:hypothetical protein [Clostridium hydrogeniformans]